MKKSISNLNLISSRICSSFIYHKKRHVFFCQYSIKTILDYFGCGGLFFSFFAISIIYSVMFCFLPVSLSTSSTMSPSYPLALPFMTTTWCSPSAAALVIDSTFLCCWATALLSLFLGRLRYFFRTSFRASNSLCVFIQQGPRSSRS